MSVAAPRLETRRRGKVRAGAGGPRYPAWLAVPALAYYALFFLCPLALMAAMSLAEREGFVDFVYALNWENFTDLWDPLYRGIFIDTFKMATTGTVVSLLIGYPLAYYLARYARRKTLLLLLIIVPFWTSFLIRTYAWLIILDPDFPAIRGLRSIGILPNDFSVLYTPTATYIGIVYTYLPLMILPVYAALERMDWSLVDAAQDLGDSPWRAFRRITLPLTFPGVLAGSLLVFIPMMGEYLNPVILGGDKTIFVGNLIGLQFGTSRDWPFGAAIAMVLIAAMTVIVLVYARLVSREEAYGG